MVDFTDIDVINSNSRASNFDDFNELYQYFKLNYERLPLKELQRRGLIDSTDFSSVFSYFSTSLKKPQALFRKSESADDLHSGLWALTVSNSALCVAAERNLIEFQPEFIDDSLISALKEMTISPESVAQVPDLLEKIGVVLIFERTLSSSKADGVAGRVFGKVPYIGMSLRYKRLDNFWFTLLHELAHLKLHYDKLDVPIIDSDDDQKSDLIELEADRFALEAFIPRYIWSRSNLIYGATPNHDAILKFADKVNVHPAIVAGRLRRTLNRWDIHSDLVNSVNVRALIWGQD